MGRRSSSKRASLVEAADSLMHLQGFRETTLSDVATRAGVPLGNVYYYFKSKNDLGGAVIARRAEAYGGLTTEWEKQSDPRDRIAAFVEYVEGQRHMLAQSGCPIGSLCQELNKEGGALAEQATTLFSGILDWMEAQFRICGYEAKAQGFALHVVACMQGAALLAHTFGDPEIIVREAKWVKGWIGSL